MSAAKNGGSSGVSRSVSGANAGVGRVEVALLPAEEAVSSWRAYDPGVLTTLAFRLRDEDATSQRAVLRRDSLFRRLLALADVASAGLALVISIAVLGDDQLKLTTLLALPIIVLASKIIGLYDRDELLLRKSTLDEAPALFQLSTLYAMTIWLVGPVLAVGYLGKAQVAGLWAMLFFSSLGGRALARAVARRLSDEERCVVIGEVAVAEHLRTKLDRTAKTNASVVGVIPFDDDHAEHHTSTGELGVLLGSLAAERVILAPRSGDSDRTLELIRTIKALGIRVSVLPRIAEIVGSSVKLDDVSGVPMLGVRRFGLTTSSQFVKRAFDVVGAAFGLVLASPAFALFALAIKLDSPGPVFFRQGRIGLHGEQFEMIKFRTMEDGADERKSELLELNEADGLFKIARDPRVTRVGRFLRSTWLDELPQLWNVLRGEMSLVGPRPLVADDDRRVAGWHRRRLHLTPGMTGQWQILGASRIPLHEMVELDYLYVANWSLWSDIKIMLRTIPHVLARSGQ